MKTLKTKEVVAKPHGSGDNLTTIYVQRLNKLHEAGVMGWVEQGRLVSEYIAKRDPTGKSRIDFHKQLASHPESLHQPSQLRNYENCYNLYMEFGGDKKAPTLPMSHYILVLSSAMDSDDKCKFLKLSVEKELSVSELKRLIKNRFIGTESKIDQWKQSRTLSKTTEQLKATVEKAYDLLVELHRLSKGKGDNEINKRLNVLLRFALGHGYVAAEGGRA